MEGAEYPYSQTGSRSKRYGYVLGVDANPGNVHDSTGDYLELAEDYRHTPKYKKLYARRKETIERVFADAKEKYAMRYTQYRGLTQVSNWVKLKFAAMNLKKFAIHRWEMAQKHPHDSMFLHIFHFVININPASV